MLLLEDGYIIYVEEEEEERNVSILGRVKYRTGYSLYHIDIDIDIGGDGTWSTEEVAVVDCVPTES